MNSFVVAFVLLAAVLLVFGVVMGLLYVAWTAFFALCEAIRTLWVDWRAACVERAYDNGYAWATNELDRGRHLEDVSLDIDCGMMFDEKLHPFDAGALAAINACVDIRYGRYNLGKPL